MKSHTMQNKFKAYKGRYTGVAEHTRVMDCDDPMLKGWGHDPKQWERVKGVFPWHGEQKYLEKCKYIDRINTGMLESMAPYMNEESHSWHIQFWTKEGHVITTFCDLNGDRVRMSDAYEEILDEMGIEIRHIARLVV